MTPEFARPVRLDTIGRGRAERLVADEAERRGVATRFALEALDRLEADWTLSPNDEGILATGRIRADGAQSCVTTGEPVPFRQDATVRLLFTHDPLPEPTIEEFELDTDDLDRVEIEGGTIDLGEATAQSMALDLDPWPRAPDADERRRELGIATEVETSPFAKLLGLKTT